MIRGAEGAALTFFFFFFSDPWSSLCFRFFALASGMVEVVVRICVLRLYVNGGQNFERRRQKRPNSAPHRLPKQIAAAPHRLTRHHSYFHSFKMW